MKKILITGGAGFIGSHLVEELVKKGFEIRVIDNLSTGKSENLAGLEAEFLRLDIAKDDLTDAFKDIDIVYHLAAIGSVQRSIDSPPETTQVNTGGTMRVLQAARDAGVKKFIYASSSAVYGDSPTLPRKESQPAIPLSPYAASKLAGELYCYSMFRSAGLDTVSFRFFNVYGSRQDARSIYSAVIPRFMTQAIEGKPFTIYGDGLQSRDFTFVKDVVTTLIIAANTDSISGLTMNLATGKQTTVIELAQMISKVVGITARFEFSPARSGEVRFSYADTSLARRKLGYSPKHLLEEGLKLTLEWFRNLRNH